MVKNALMGSLFNLADEEDIDKADAPATGDKPIAEEVPGDGDKPGDREALVTEVEDDGGDLFDDDDDPDEGYHPPRSLRDTLREMEEGEEETDGDKPDGDKPDGDKPDGDKPDGDKPDGDKPDGKKVKKISRDQKPAKGDDLPEFDVGPPGGAAKPLVEGFDEDKLSPEERERLDLAKFASEIEPKRFGSLAKDYAQFFKEHQEFIERARGEDPDVVFDEENEEYQKFLRKNRPVMSAADVRRLEREQIKYEVRRDSRREIEELRESQRRLRLEPEIREKVKEFGEASAAAVVPDEYQEVYKEKGLDGLREEFPIEADAVESTVKAVANYGGEFLKLSNGLVDFDEKNELHNNIARFVEEQGRAFHEKGGDARFFKGKQFLPRSTYAKAAAAGKADKYWTFTDQDILDILQAEGKRHAAAATRAERDRLEKAGYARRRPDPQGGGDPPPEKKPEKPAAPKTKASPRQGSSTGGVPEGKGKHPFSVLGY